MVASASVILNEDQGSLTLPAAVRMHLGQALSNAYDEVPGALPHQFNDLITRLSSALAAQADRDELAFRRELIAFMPNLQRFAMKLAKSSAHADDLVQDTLVRAWRARTRFTLGTNLGAWLFTIMRNVFYSNVRKATYEYSASDEELTGVLKTLPDQLDHLEVQDVQLVLSGLTAVMRQALILVSIDGLTYEAAAEVLGCQVGTVKSRVWRAREQLMARVGYSASDLGADHLTLSIFSGQGAPTLR